ncbi:MAG: fumarylacetoacetate hydrolase family protein [Halobacteriales archaeon]|nr:fumarylacetoacetate hydrolase family protein [Halobacteriales archaeon]
MHLTLTSGEQLPAGKVIGLVGNYAAHRVEMGHAPDLEALHFFLKASSALLPGGGKLFLPKVGRIEHEVELAVIIGERARRVRSADAMRHVLGYAVGLDVTARELQALAKAKGLPWDEAKGYDTFAPLSAVRPAAEVPDPHGLDIELLVNGEARQRGSTAQMLVRVPGIVERLSSVMTLEQGDVIFTGTPGGVGPILSGDRLHARIAGVGELRCDAVEA